MRNKKGGVSKASNQTHNDERMMAAAKSNQIGERDKYRRGITHPGIHTHREREITTIRRRRPGISRVYTVQMHISWA